MGRTFAIGDIHGDAQALDVLLGRLPIVRGDTIVFVGDYVDRGPDSVAVVRRVRELEASSPARIVALRGNHEDAWISCYKSPDPRFLLQPRNGCANTYRSFVGGPPLDEDESLWPDSLEEQRFLDVASWLPRDVVQWMNGLPLWFENEHAIFVHAGLEEDAVGWKHPSQSSREDLLWMRRRDFFLGYEGKRLVFGHTTVEDLPDEGIDFSADFEETVWRRGPLVGLDTACGKGGFLSAVELPSGKIVDSRLTQSDRVVLPARRISA